MTYALIAGVDPRFGLYSAIVVTLVASIFGSSSHLINGPTNAISPVVFSSLIGFDVRFDAAKAGESGHSVLVPPVGTIAQSGPYDLLAVGLGTLLAALLLCRVINGLQAPANGYAGGTLDMQAIVSGVLTFDSA
jgi:MFS superfamily sulfate permease-like transporter